MTMTFNVSENETTIPTIHIISDSVGITARTIAQAAASQFGVTDPNIETLSNVRSSKEIEDFLDMHALYHEKLYDDNRLVVFFTLVDKSIHDDLDYYLQTHPNVLAVDLMSAAIDAISQVSGKKPLVIPGEVHITDENYFRRIAAMEFTIAHDDGRNPQDLPFADIVLLGVSRSSKTPTSIYLSQQGYRVANVPLDLDTDPPREIFDVEPSRIFGLMTTADILVDIRKRRLGNAWGVALSYVNPELVEEDLEKARSLMRKLGCIVIHTDNRAVEETAQEIMRYYKTAHPRKKL